MRFASPFDEAAFLTGPPAIYTLDPRQQLRIDPERTRECHLLVEVPPEREEGFFVLLDHATGLRLLLVVTHPILATCQPRGRVERHPTYDSAVAKTME